MRIISIVSVVGLLLIVSRGVAHGQSFGLSVSAGPTIIDRGHSVTAGLGFSPTRHLTLAFNAERTHLSTRVSSDGRGGFSSFRGGTMMLGTGELRIAPLGHDRIGPYGLAGFAAGVSRPNVNDVFPNRVTNAARAVFFGGGLHVPVGEGLSMFVDARMMVGAEGDEGIVAVVPIRGGISWRF